MSQLIGQVDVSMKTEFSKSAFSKFGSFLNFIFGGINFGAGLT